MAYTIGRATLNDLPALIELESLFPSDWISKRQFRYHIQNPHAVFLVARSSLDQTPVGYALFLMRQKKWARFYSLIVDPKAQGKGLGRQLCQAGIDTLQKHKISEISLEVDNSDTRAIHLYKSLGFKEFKILSDYYEDHRDALKMKRTTGLLAHG